MSTSRHFQIILDTGFAVFDPESNRYLLRPDRGSGGFALYSSEHRAKLQMGDGEQLQRVQLVMVLL